MGEGRSEGDVGDGREVNQNALSTNTHTTTPPGKIRHLLIDSRKLGRIRSSFFSFNLSLKKLTQLSYLTTLSSRLNATGGNLNKGQQR